MEIKVNDYVRTRQGYIAKIENETDDSYWCDDTIEYVYEPSPFIFKDKANKIIVKSSPNIGKLLKVGDFIDGMRIIEIEDTTIHTLGGWFIDVDDVEDLVTSIVTKEMFEQMEYKLEKEVN